jgi:osmotically-inducible protein OsmY
MTPKSDADLQDEVMRELERDTRVLPNDIGVLVDGGVVTLRGAVDSWARVRAAEDAAHRVRGVLDVANELVVSIDAPRERSDAELAHDVRQALEWNVSGTEEQIRSTVSQGTVALEGRAPFWSTRADAERAVERLAGVRRVLNHIRVVPTTPVRLSDARAAVERALARLAVAEASHIDLRVTDGIVSVTGVVHTVPEKNAILAAVRETRGVKDVADHVRVEPWV